MKKLYHLASATGEAIMRFGSTSNSVREETAISLFWKNHKRGFDASNIRDAYRGLELLNEIEDSRHDDEELMKRTVANKKFFLKLVEFFEENLASIPEPVVVMEPLPVVTFSITTCKRFTEFEKTMRAFLKNCLDRHLIHRWICIDDNSSETDREKMKKQFPFFEFVWKSPEQKGHVQSMNILTKMVTTPFLLHNEDDRVLVDPKKYIGPMIEILNHDETLGQVIFNHNYTETLEDDVVGGFLKKTDSNVFYYEHEYSPTEESRRLFFQKYGHDKTSSTHYPHFSLSPGLTRTEIFRDDGFRDEERFERKFAERYTTRGYKTAFLPGFHNKHIGRLIRDREDFTKFNAYDLALVSQFDNLPPHEFVVVDSPDSKLHFKTYKEVVRRGGDGIVVWPRKFSTEDILKTFIFRIFTIASSPDAILFDYKFDESADVSSPKVVTEMKIESVEEDVSYCYYLSRHAMNIVLENGKDLVKIYDTINPILFKTSPMMKTFFATPPISRFVSPKKQQSVDGHENCRKSTTL